MGWRLRTNNDASNDSSSNVPPNGTLNSSTSLMDLSRSLIEYSELETQSNNTDGQMPRRRRCGIQHGVSGRSNSIAHAPFFTIDNSNRLQVTTLPS